MQVSRCNYPIWYCPQYPISEIRVSQKVPREGREEWRIALARNIEQNGLVNPLIILNHRDPSQWEHRWLMVGTNRLWALQYLGWTTAPAIVTGECPYECVAVAPDELQDYFRDGEVYFDTTGPRLRKTTPPEEGRYPDGSHGVRVAQA